MQPNSSKNFDSELQAYFNSIKRTIKEEHTTYLKSHPELRQILNDYLSSCLLEQPQNVYSYAQKFFGFFNYQKDTVKYMPLVISGNSGVGKTTIINKLLTAMPQLLQLSISYTTRRPRQGEVHGRQYFFVGKQEFQKEITKGVFAEYSEINGNYYGTHRGKLNAIMAKSKICILDIDLDGSQKIHEMFPQFTFIFVQAPSVQALQQRLSSRLADQPEVIAKILRTAEQNSAKVKQLGYYTCFVNDQLEECVKQIVNFILNKYTIK